MSYCRWSSDCHQSDVYVYEDMNGGWTTHVAGGRRHPLRSVPAPPDTTTANMFIVYWMACERWVCDESNWEWRPIDAKFAGLSFNDGSAKDCADRLRSLKAAGLNVPQYAIDELDAECNEAKTESAPDFLDSDQS